MSRSDSRQFIPIASESEESHHSEALLRTKTVARAAIVPIAGGLLLTIAVGLLQDSFTAQASMSHIVGFDAEDDMCHKWEKRLVRVIEHEFMATLKGLVTNSGCAVDESSEGSCEDEEKMMEGAFPKCKEDEACSKAQVNISFRLVNLTIGPAAQHGKKDGKDLHIKQIAVKLKRIHDFPSSCKGQLKLALEGDEDSDATMFHANHFCNINAKRQRLPTVHSCKASDYTNNPDDMPKCNRMEKLVGKKIEMWRASFHSFCKGTLEFQE